LVFVLVERLARGTRVSVRMLCVVTLLPPTLALLAWIAAAGGASTWLATITTIKSSLAHNVFAYDFLSGPWYRYLIDFLLVSPLTTLLALAYLGLVALRLRRGEWERPQAYLAIAAAGLLLEFGLIEKSLRYLLVLELV